MANLFLSYAREDRECAALLANTLSRHGWTVWWDREIAVGHYFSEVIERELDQAQCIIVIWSQHAVKSEWVRNEAAEAARRRVLVPLRIEEVRLPLEFRGLQTANILDWRNGFTGFDFDRCLQSIEHLVPRASSESTARHTTAQVERKTIDVDPDKVEQLFKAAGAASVSEDVVAASTQTAATGFWISQNGEQHCVPDLTTLQSWANEGRLRLDGYVYDSMLQRWIRAYEVPDLRTIYRKSVPNQKSRQTAKFPPSFDSKVAVSSTAHTATKAPAEQAQQAVDAGFWINQGRVQFRAPDAATLLAWAEEGRVKPNSQVHDPVLQQWIRADEMPDLRSVYQNRAARVPPSYDANGAVLSAAHTATPATEGQAQQAVDTGFWITQKKIQFRAPDAATLRAWAEEGRVKPDSQVHDPALQQWTRADEMPDLRSTYQRRAAKQKNRQPSTPRRELIISGALIGFVILIVFVGAWVNLNSRADSSTTDTHTSATTNTATTEVTSASMEFTLTATDTTGTGTMADQAIAVSLQNQCTDKSINVAVAYLNRANQWISTGWYNVPAASTKSDVLTVVGPLIYFYGLSAATDNAKWECGPSDSPCLNVPVKLQDKFDSPIEGTKGDGVTYVRFFGRRVVSSTWTQIFFCKS